MTTKQTDHEIFSLRFQQVVFKYHTILSGCSVCHSTRKTNRGWITILDNCGKQAHLRLQAQLFGDYFLLVTSSGFHGIYMLSCMFFLRMELFCCDPLYLACLLDLFHFKKQIVFSSIFLTAKGVYANNIMFVQQNPCAKLAPIWVFLNGIVLFIMINSGVYSFTIGLG